MKRRIYVTSLVDTPTLFFFFFSLFLVIKKNMADARVFWGEKQTWNIYFGVVKTFWSRTLIKASVNKEIFLQAVK